MERNVNKLALDIWDGGACNPRAVARALVECIDAGANAGGSKGASTPATRIVLAQLCHLLDHVAGDGHGDYKSASGATAWTDIDALRAVVASEEGQA